MTGYSCAVQGQSIFLRCFRVFPYFLGLSMLLSKHVFFSGHTLLARLNQLTSRSQQLDSLQSSLSLLCLLTPLVSHPHLDLVRDTGRQGKNDIVK